MSTYRLDRLFAPRSIAVVGGSPRATSPGRAVLKNLRSAGFAGAIHLVNPHYDSIEGVQAVKSYAALPGTPRAGTACRRDGKDHYFLQRGMSAFGTKQTFQD